MKRILLTGSSGFIGKHLKEFFTGKSDKYRLLCPTHRELDLTDKALVRRFFSEHNIDVVIHCANVNNVMHPMEQYEFFRAGFQMFLSLEASADLVEKIIYFGSGAEYERHFGKPLIKESDLGTSIPADPYGLAKYMEARLTENNDNIYDLCLFGVYGKYEEWQRRFISNNMVRSLNGLPMTISRNAMFDYLYVDDLCRIVEWFVCNTPKHKRYNVCTGQPVSLLALAEMINEISGFDREILIEKDGWQTEYSGDNSRLLDEIGSFLFADKKRSMEEMWEYFRRVDNNYETDLCSDGNKS